MLITLESGLIFHSRSFFRSLDRQTIVRVLQNAAAQPGATIETVNQMFAKAFSALGRVAPLSPLPEVIALFIIYDLRLVLFTVLHFRMNEFAHIMQSKSFEGVTNPFSRQTE